VNWSKPIAATLLAVGGLVGLVGLVGCGGGAAAGGGQGAATEAASGPAADLQITATATVTPTITPTPTPNYSGMHPLTIERMRRDAYPGSDFVIEETLAGGSNYDRFVASYLSEGLKIRGMLTVPRGETPASGWPVIVFNHGYIPPRQYRTTERYVAYLDAFARNGYVVFKSDYRGHGSSEGAAAGGYGSPAYTVDVLNAMASVLRRDDVDPERVGMWGHSMGGQITLRSMVVTDTVKAGVIWAGVVASYPDLFERWRRPPSDATIASPTGTPRGWRSDLYRTYGDPVANPEFWASISPTSYLAEISGPLQLQHGSADHSVPLEFSESLQADMEAVGKPSEILVYQGDDHNIAANLSTALARSVEFFDTHVKGVAPSEG
jgi:dipeptidyl aminopeptidase/acylaminoacyl peptidase